ncbi:MAG: DEAD/DEAH box helicase family protein [Leptospiraceae bacterium]|nr:DEAD/DEAH box helicase family protein [Leptospiraceae bacterium]MCB1303078.1 DEAD/DEAH box helicase family protein [Leptospiraceae bacterium]
MHQQILHLEYEDSLAAEQNPAQETSYFRPLDKENAEFAFRLLDAHRVKLNHIYDKLSSLSNSRTRLLPHQIEATYRVVQALRPRFILADEVGLGKTIEAGLVIKELMLRKGYNRVIVAAPATLTVQWQQEMRSKFNEEFVIMDRSNFHRIAARWASYPRILVSIDFIKNEKYGAQVLKANWDIAVFDEAHRLRRDDSKITHAYSFAEQLAKRVDALLLLTATPFRGKLEELFYLVRLVDPHILGPRNSFFMEYVLPSRSGGSVKDLKSRLERILLRRRKVEVGGFTKRFASTIRFDLSPPERAFYDETTEYVRREYNLAMQEKNRAVGFVMIAFQKLLDSSTRALLRALEKRRAMLEMRMHQTSLLVDTSWKLEDIDPELDDWDEDDLADDEGSFQKSYKDLRKEVLTLGKLIHLGRAIKQDKKLVKLKETLARLKKEGHHKFIIFTQFRTTQDYLAENLQEYRVELFHGSLNLKEKEEAIENFRGEQEILICTEAGGEGRNLQFASILINYDLPWSPLKIEQRIGRIHRFGQTRDVFIINFATRDTVAERILEVLENKIRLFEESIGPSDMLLGSIEDDLKFSSTLMDFVSGKLDQNTFESTVEERVSMARSSYERLNELVAPRLVDFNLNDYYRITEKERAIKNSEIEHLCLYYTNIGESRFLLRKSDEGIYEITDCRTSEKRNGTFDSELALSRDSLDFLAVGHPLVDECLDYFLHHGEKETYLAMKAPDGLQPGHYFIFIVQFENGFKRTELMGIHIDAEERMTFHREIVIPPGFRLPKKAFSQIASDSADAMESIRPALRRAELLLRSEAEQIAKELKEELHPVFKKEEYKIEISYGKKLRLLEEKKDIEKMKYNQNPAPERKARLTRTENLILKARQEMDLQMEEIRRQSRMKLDIRPLQVYRLL